MGDARLQSANRLPAGSYAFCLAAAVCIGIVAPSVVFAVDQPNIILVVTDDQGYNDLGCFGSKLIRTPNIDRMAAEGLKLTSYYSSAPLCAPSRASLMTGCYSQRLAEPDDIKRFHTILDASEVCLPELLRKVGYQTCAIGKWHLAGGGRGCIAVDDGKEGTARYSLKRPEVMPCQKGFDQYFGIPYSNDMNPVVLLRDNRAVEYLGQSEKQAGISTRYTDEAIEFIEKAAGEPFFLYLAHNMPHTPLYPHPRFAGKSEYGLYGDCIEEIDWNMGRLLDKLTALGIDQNTFVIFTSDNGPWIDPHTKGRNPAAKTSRLQGGRADPLRGYKMTTHEGGVRVPCVMRFPSRIPPNRTLEQMVTALDFFPTFLGIAGAEPPRDRVIDGADVMALLCGDDVSSPRSDFYYYKWTHLHGVRNGDWKLVLERTARPKDLGWYNRLQEAVEETTLYNLKNDISETTNVAADHPQVVARLMEIVAKSQHELGDGSRGLTGVGAR